MATSGELMDELETARAEALAICARANKASREFTAEERLRVDMLQSTIKSVGRQMNTKSGDDAIRDELRRLGAFGDGTSHSNPSGGGRGAWAKAFETAMPSLPSYGKKDLIAPAGSVNVPSPVMILPGLDELGRVETLLQLIPRETVGATDGYSFLRETVRSHQAATVAAKEVKPTSIYTLERVDDRVRVIAHLSEPVPRAYLADFSLLGRYLDGVLRQGLMLQLEWQIIGGQGVGEDFSGLLMMAGQVQPFDTTILTTCRKAQTLLEVLEIQPGAYVFNPQDWETIELSQDLVNNFYLSSNSPDTSQSLPVDRARRRLWGLPVALSNGMPQGEAILADFAGSTHSWVREEARVDWSEATWDSQAQATDFTRNLVRYRAETRQGFAVTRPAGVVRIELPLSGT